MSSSGSSGANSCSAVVGAETDNTEGMPVKRTKHNVFRTNKSDHTEGIPANLALEEAIRRSRLQWESTLVAGARTVRPKLSNPCNCHQIYASAGVSSTPMTIDESLVASDQTPMTIDEPPPRC